jgi:aryl-alcohol dehydrogenase-like predicted oxidoreductase
MQYTPLRRAGLQASRLALGTMNFGELTDQTVALQIWPRAGGEALQAYTW